MTLGEGGIRLPLPSNVEDFSFVFLKILYFFDFFDVLCPSALTSFSLPLIFFLPSLAGNFLGCPLCLLSLILFFFSLPNLYNF